MTDCVLILGSGPDVVRCRDWDLSGFDAVVAINNAWRVRPDWTHSIFPDDFPEDRHPDPVGPEQRIVRAGSYVASMNRFGGVVYIGATMAFSATAWVLDALAPRVIAYLGCDMVYAANGDTHFYGIGTADPLRSDPTLQSLQAKARRMQAIAAGQGTALVNLSRGGESRLPYPRADLRTCAAACPETPDAGAVAAALAREAEAGLRVPSGRYWEVVDRLDDAMLAEIDALWLAAYGEMRG